MLFGQGDVMNALSLLREAAHAAPQRADIAYNYGVVLQRAGFLGEAVHAWTRATNLAPQHAAPWVNLALGLILLKNFDEALAIYKQALTHHPADRDLLFSYGNLLYRMGQRQESWAIYQRLLAAYPDDIQGLINAGKAAKSIGKLREAEQFCRRVIAQQSPEYTAQARFNLANILLMQGQWVEGFAAHEARRNLKDSIGNPWGLPNIHDALKPGSRILLWNDQGAGDAMMYARFLPAFMPKYVGHRFFFLAQKSIAPLFAAMEGIEKVLTTDDAPQPMDACVSLCSLPHLLQVNPEQSWTGPYLKVEKQTTPSLPPRKNPSSKRIALVWAGRASHENDANRSMRLADFAPLLSLPQTEWFSLQVGEQNKELHDLPEALRPTDLAPRLTDFAVTAQMMREMDLIISVDTGTAHLAGALGRPVWTLLPLIDCDWRWGLSGERSFWYPTMKLFRQSEPKKWSDVIAHMANELMLGA